MAVLQTPCPKSLLDSLFSQQRCHQKLSKLANVCQTYSVKLVTRRRF